MSKHMERDLERLQRSILRMAGAVEEAIYQATQALQDRDPARARQVIDGDGEIDRLENEVQDECLKILALHQPVAVDLRRVSAVLLDLDRPGADGRPGGRDRRAGDCRWPARRTPTVPDRLAQMTTRATEMVRRSLDAFVNLDPVAARAVIRLDDEVDEDNEAIIAELIAEMKPSPGPDRVGDVAVLGRAAPGADRRPRHQHRRGRDLPRRGARWSATTPRRSRGRDLRSYRPDRSSAARVAATSSRLVATPLRVAAVAALVGESAAARRTTRGPGRSRSASATSATDRSPGSGRTAAPRSARPRRLTSSAIAGDAGQRGRLPAAGQHPREPESRSARPAASPGPGTRSNARWKTHGSPPARVTELADRVGVDPAVGRRARRRRTRRAGAAGRASMSRAMTRSSAGRVDEVPRPRADHDDDRQPGRGRAPPGTRPTRRRQPAEVERGAQLDPVGPAPLRGDGVVRPSRPRPRSAPAGCCARSLPAPGHLAATPARRRGTPASGSRRGPCGSAPSCSRG